MKKLSKFFGILAIVLSHVMCAYISFAYANMLCGIDHKGYSAHPRIVFLYAIPFLIAIIACVIISVVLKSKTQRMGI